MYGSLCVNEGKNLVVENGRQRYYCYALKTKVAGPEDNLADIAEEYIKPVLSSGDVVFISEKMVSCIQGRAVAMADIKPGWLARFLSGFVAKTPYGIGLGMPETMECAIKECGVLRILVASAAGLVGKILGKKGWFYMVAGYRAACIDGPCKWTIPPYNRYVVLAPENPDQVAEELSAQLGGNTVLIVDLNDLGGSILGCSDSKTDLDFYLELLKQNPLGQGGQSTPAGILRPME